MREVLLVLSNGDTLTLSEGQTVMPISFIRRDEESFASRGAPYQLTSTVQEQLIPCIVELLCKYEFFQILDDEKNIVYQSSAVVSIQNV